MAEAWVARAAAAQQEPAASAGGAGGKKRGDGTTSLPPPSSSSSTALRSALDAGEENYYNLLGLMAVGFNATPKQIKIAYHKRLLELHPDKAAGEVVKDDTDPVFLAVQKAYAVLSDEERRRGYDSQFDFDDSIPGEAFRHGADGDFFAVFGPVFERNARFSTIKPVPLLGDDATADDTVRDFYAFWHKFDSWRDFSSLDEHKVDEAESRDEKRWLMQQNKAARAKRKKKEYARVEMLVSRAEAVDPRVARARLAQQEAKRLAREQREAKRQAEEEARQAAEADAAAADAAAAALAKEEAEVARQAKQKSAKLLRKARKTLKDLAAPDAITPVELAELCGALDLDQCTAYIKEIEDGGGAGSAAASAVPRKALAAFAEKQAAEEEVKEAARRARAAAEAEEQARRDAAKEVPWGDDELALLIKAVKKFPGGTRKRWTIVADQVNTLGLAHSRTEKECIAKANSITNADIAQLAEGGLVASAKKSAGSAKVVKKTPAPAKAAAAAAAAAAPSTTGKGGGGGKANAPAAGAAGADDWTKDQQTALEGALQKYPASMDKKERWNSIAAAVPGKDRKACIGRFKAIRAQVMAAKKQ